ncbi:MAG TPA: META domain-containing protein [Anaerolineae bacterium]|nr:META domain-containing protein [Anaerolineae bacterium]
MKVALSVFSLFFLFAALLAACAGTAVPTLDGTGWQLVEMDGARLPLHVLITLSFDKAQAGGSGPCNGYGADYVQKGTELTLGQIVSTLMYCDGVMEYEKAYTDALGTVRSFQREGNTLRLLDESGKVALVFGKPQAANLDGSSWKVALVGETPVPEGVELTMGFAGGEATGKAGCNTYFAGYAQEGAGLTYDSPGATKMYCGAEGLMQLESTFLGSLEQVRSFEIQRGGLALLDEAGATVMYLLP